MFASFADIHIEARKIDHRSIFKCPSTTTLLNRRHANIWANAAIYTQISKKLFPPQQLNIIRQQGD